MRGTKASAMRSVALVSNGRLGNSLVMQFLAISGIQYRPAFVHVSHILENRISAFPIEEIVGRHGNFNVVEQSQFLPKHFPGHRLVIDDECTHTRHQPSFTSLL